MIEDERQKSGLLERDLAAARVDRGFAEEGCAGGGRAGGCPEESPGGRGRGGAGQAGDRGRTAKERPPGARFGCCARVDQALETKVAPAAAEQAAAVKSRQAAEAALAQAKRVIEDERQKSGLLERDLAAARKSINILEAKIASAAAGQANAVKSRRATKGSRAEDGVLVRAPAQATPRAIRKVKDRKPPRSAPQATMMLPKELLPTRLRRP